LHINDGEPHTYQIDKEAGTGYYILVNSVSFEKYRASVQSCDCPGFRYRRTCKHVEALRLIKGSKMTSEVAEVKQEKSLAEFFVKNDLSTLSDDKKVAYYMQVCEDVGLNPSTRPFEFMKLKTKGGGEKTVLYATKSGAEQLRRRYRVSVEIVSKEIKGDVFVVEVRAVDKDGRIDSDLGVVTIAGLKGDDLCNAIMKAITKAKRRVTLSICGLGMLDETEIDTIPNAVKLPPIQMPQIKDKLMEPVGDAYEPEDAQKVVLLEEIEEIFQGFPPSDVGKWLLKNYKKNVFADLTADELRDAISRAKKK